MIKIDEADPVGDIDLAFPCRQVSVKRGEDMKKYYDLNEEIGRGKFGTVYKCKEKSSGQHLAAKFIAVPNRKERKNVEREIDMMNRLQHPKIIQLYDAFEYNKMVCVVLELVEGGELFDRVLDDKFVLTEKACSIFVRQICDALEFIHERNIIHLDLKPENILCLTEAGNRIKIIDFGLAREYDPNEKLQVLFGTPEFVAPEVVNFEEITFATDMWSIGVVAYVLVSGLSPFAGECDAETMGNVTVGKYDFNDEAFDNVSADCMDFITKLLKKNPTERMTAHDALKHRWVKKKPQYHPTNSKPAGSPLSFKAVYLDKDNNMSTSTKDNLKNCVERWNDTSPYVFDKHTKSISSVHSSISSSIDEEKSNDDENKSHSQSSPSASHLLFDDQLLSNSINHRDIHSTLNSHSQPPPIHHHPKLLDSGTRKCDIIITSSPPTSDENHKSSKNVTNNNNASSSSTSPSSSPQSPQISPSSLQFQLANQSSSSSASTENSFSFSNIGNNHPPSKSNPIISLRDYYSYLYALDRPKSIDNSFLSPSPLTSDDEFGLFHEIERITQHLFKLTVPGMLPADEIRSVNNNNNNIDKDSRIGLLKEHDTTSSSNSQSTCAIKMQTTISDDTLSVENVNGVGKRNDSCEYSTKEKDIDIHMKLDENNNNNYSTRINDTQWNLSTSRSQRPFADIIDRLTSPTAIRDGFDFTTSIVHWPVSTRRTKFRVNQMSSRDVPIIKDCKPAKLQKQNAIDACDDASMVIDDDAEHCTNSKCGDIGDKSTRDSNATKFSNHKIFMQNGSSSIDCGQLSVEQRSMSMFRSIFELHASTGRTVRKMQSHIESKQNVSETSSKTVNHHENWIKSPSK